MSPTIVASRLAAENGIVQGGLSIDRSAFYGLRLNPQVRAIRPIGHADTREAVWDGDALAVADKYGAAEVVITLKGGPSFSAMSGYMSQRERSTHATANRRAF
ncbi:hypothetical protein [Ramlibacter sp.]|uniref:hypothetical protein n=1 Tax=Ramlibacter sp. TaxID=1917967 RepID=UPI0017B232F1|nr:hypothetical protein [Ramlibacter sp.]MBA2672727.1 hypothetical protein [Ramlibacter sp.]